MTVREVLDKDSSFKYALLDRMRTDCEYYPENGSRSDNILWANDVVMQITYMKAVWNSFPKNAKPQWLKYGDIVEYGRRMGCDEN